MSKFNDTIKKYITEQGGNIMFNPTAASSTSIPANPQLKKAAEVMDTVGGILGGPVKQTPEEISKALLNALAPFKVKPEEVNKFISDYLKEIKYTEQDQQPQSSENSNSTTSNSPTTPKTPNRSNTPNTSTSTTYTAGAPKA